MGGAFVLVGFWVPRCFGPTAPDDELCRFVGGMLCVGGLGREDGAASRSILILDEQNAGTVRMDVRMDTPFRQATSSPSPFCVLCSSPRLLPRKRRNGRDETRRAIKHHPGVPTAL